MTHGARAVDPPSRYAGTHRVRARTTLGVSGVDESGFTPSLTLRQMLMKLSQNSVSSVTSDTPAQNARDWFLPRPRSLAPFHALLERRQTRAQLV
jgi:hypothetical protein